VAELLVAQFDVHRNPRGGLFPLLLDVQADLLSALATRVVVPMARARRYATKPLTVMNPTATLRRVEYVLVFQELAAIPTAMLGKPVGSLSSRREELIAALDLLFTGI
jgi:toxin CcdB